MTDPSRDIGIEVAGLLTRYCFDTDGYPVEQQVHSWLHTYPNRWLRLAVVEALYQGRYKSISVEQILNFWQRRGSPIYHFNREFERIICGRSFNPFLTYDTQPEAPPPKPLTPITSIPSFSPTASLPNLEPPAELSAEPQAEPQVEPQVEPQAEPDVEAGIEQGTEAAWETGAGEEQTTHASYAAYATDEADNETSPEAASSDALPPLEQSEHLDDVPQTKPGELPIQPFKPEANGIASLIEGMIQVKPVSAPYPIDQFVPTPEPSDFYSKLKAVAQETMPTAPDSATPRLPVNDADEPTEVQSDLPPEETL